MKNILLHLRLPFSFFLLPIYLFALSQVLHINTAKAWWVFFILHFLLFPASNAFNSYYDKDEGSIALVEVPPVVSKNLLYVSWVMDVMALLLAATVSWIFFISVLVYGTISKLYSHPQFRLKKYAISSFVVVAFFQGAFVCYSSILALANETDFVWNDDWTLISMISSCIIGASSTIK
ncbi:MAG: ubiquinone biosynthesis protein UbiA, partial [Runella slithyformis]